MYKTLDEVKDGDIIVTRNEGNFIVSQNALVQFMSNRMDNGLELSDSEWNFNSGRSLDGLDSYDIMAVYPYSFKRAKELFESGDKWAIEVDNVLWLAPELRKPESKSEPEKITSKLSPTMNLLIKEMIKDTDTNILEAFIELYTEEINKRKNEQFK